MLARIKTLLAIADDSQDEKLQTILELTISRLASLLGTDTVPSSMDYIAIEVAVRRFNRIGSEGMSSHGVEGESISFQENDFSDFMDEIDTWRREQKNPKARIRFL